MILHLECTVQFILSDFFEKAIQTALKAICCKFMQHENKKVK